MGNILTSLGEWGKHTVLHAKLNIANKGLAKIIAQVFKRNEGITLGSENIFYNRLRR